MKSPIFLLLIMSIAAGCAEKAENLDNNEVSEHFSDVYFMPDTILYVDEWGDPVNGEYETEVSESSTEIRMEFEDGQIKEGVFTKNDGTTLMIYEQREGLLAQISYHENGEKAAEFMMDDERDIVASSTWYEDGTPHMIFNADSALTWHENGQLSSKVYLTDGEMDGEGKSWHENGELASISHYKDDEWHGIFKKWDENGNLIEEKTYDMGMPEGVHKYWDEGGNLIEERAFEDGKPVPMVSEN